MAIARSTRRSAAPRKPLAAKKGRVPLVTTNRPRTFRVSEDRRTSGRLEPSFREALRAAAAMDGLSPAEWAQERGVFDRPRARSSALRVALLEFFVTQSRKSSAKRGAARRVSA